MGRIECAHFLKYLPSYLIRGRMLAILPLSTAEHLRRQGAKKQRRAEGEAMQARVRTEISARAIAKPEKMVRVFAP